MTWLNLSKSKKEIPFSLLFGLLSILLGLVQFQVPGVSGTNTDLREIPLLISVFHLNSLLSFFIVSAITALGTLPLEGAHYFTSFSNHIIPLLFAGQFYKYLRHKEQKATMLGIYWFFFYDCLLLCSVNTSWNHT